MTVVVEGPRAIYLGAQAELVQDERELAWAEPHIARNNAFKYVLGKFVEADNPNSNGHLFPFGELKDARSSIAHSPMNMLHRPHHVVGAFIATEMVYPVGATAAVGEPGAHPYVEALAAFWRYYFPDEYLAVEAAYKQGALFYSMECVPAKLACVDASCNQEFAYDGRASITYCAHLNASGSVKRLVSPHFTGGGLIIPPTLPGWKRADITELAGMIEANLEQAEAVYGQISEEFSHLDAEEWEAMMAHVVAAAMAKPHFFEADPKTGKCKVCGGSKDSKGHLPPAKP